MHRDPWERIVCASAAGLYESNYLKANSPDGRWGLWLKHNLLRPLQGEGMAEFWFILSSPDRQPVVAKKEVPLQEVSLDPNQIAIASKHIQLSDIQASGSIADIRWDLRLSDADEPLIHYPWDWMYRAGFPKKKAVTPAPHLHFRGVIEVAGQSIPVDQWEGLRGHNWGKEHAWSYAYGNCHLWHDGARRTFDGFSARIRLPGGMRSPWLSSVVARDPDHQFNRPVHWFDRVQLTPTAWTLQGSRYSLDMQATPERMVGLRYAHPNGEESYCYNTKFAAVRWHVDGTTFESDKGEFESLFAEPAANILLHPGSDWEQTQGDYRSQ